MNQLKYTPKIVKKEAVACLVPIKITQLNRIISTQLCNKEHIDNLISHLRHTLNNSEPRVSILKTKLKHIQNIINPKFRNLIEIVIAVIPDKIIQDLGKILHLPEEILADEKIIEYLPLIPDKSEINGFFSVASTLNECKTILAIILERLELSLASRCVLEGTEIYPIENHLITTDEFHQYKMILDFISEKIEQFRHGYPIAITEKKLFQHNLGVVNEASIVISFDRLQRFIQNNLANKNYPSFSKKSNKTQKLAKPKFLDNDFLRSPEGLSAFAKNPESTLLPEYIECQIEGLQFFDQYFRCDSIQHLSFNDFICEHHRIISTGVSGNRNYKIRVISFENSKDYKSELRPAGYRAGYPIEDTEIINIILQAFKEIGINPQGEWKINVDGIPSYALPSGIRLPNGLHIIYPDGKYIPLYFSKMNEKLSQLRNLSACNSNFQQSTSNTILHNLAIYYHLGITLHAFKRINQSLLMSQINYLLKYNGFNFIYHDNLDFIALFMDTKDFCNFFSRYVLSNNYKSEHYVFFKS
ncbi:MAG: hypothetical protein ACFFDY_07380 [Candidatus Thorarchaeota archaeon]